MEPKSKEQEGSTEKTLKKNSKDFLMKRFGGYQLLGVNLGRGSFARVELANHLLTSTKVALKIIDLNDITEPYTRKNVLRESAILKTLRHRSIVRLYETLAHHNIYCFVTEYLEGGTLYNHMREQKQKKFTEKQARFFFIRLLYAVQYLHGKGIIHRDLKLQNIMLNKGKKQIKLVDFGLSNYYNKDELLKTQCGSAEYAAPELFDKGSNYGPPVEIWSMGVILFAMTTGKMPFQAQSKDKRENFVVQIRKGMSIAHENILKNLTPGLKKLLIDMLEPDLDKRINLTNAMSNVWVTENSKNPLLHQPADVVPHEVRRKVIEKVAELYSKPIPDTIKDLNVNRFDAMHATYQILLDKCLWVQRSHSVKSSSSLTKRDPKKYSELAKYSSKNSSSIRQSASDSKPKLYTRQTFPTKRHVRPQSARPDRRMKSTLDNLKNEKFCDSSCKPSDSLLLTEYDDSLFSTVEDDVNFFVHPVTSCLTITKKSPCRERRPKTYSPPCNSFFSTDDLEQTPFFMSKSQETTSKIKTTKTTCPTTKITNDGEFRAGKINNDGDLFIKKGAVPTTESNVIGSTIEGVFEFNSSGRDAEDNVEDTVSVESDQIRVTISGHKMSSGSFKIVHESNETTPVRKHCSSAKKSSDRKPCIRCLSPYEARQMLHRDTFPVKHTFMKPSSCPTKVMVDSSSTECDKRTFEVDQEVQCANQQPVERKLKDAIITNIISTPDSLMSILSNKQSGKARSTTPTPRFSFKVADEILSHEKNANAQKIPPATALTVGRKYTRTRRVSFKE